MLCVRGGYCVQRVGAVQSWPFRMSITFAMEIANTVLRASPIRDGLDI